MEHALLGCASRPAGCRAIDSARHGLSGPHITRGKGVAGRMLPQARAESLNREATSGSIYGLRPGRRRKVVSRRTTVGVRDAGLLGRRDYVSADKFARSRFIAGDSRKRLASLNAASATARA